MDVSYYWIVNRLDICAGRFFTLVINMYSIWFLVILSWADFKFSFLFYKYFNQLIHSLYLVLLNILKSIKLLQIRKLLKEYYVKSNFVFQYKPQVQCSCSTYVHMFLLIDQNTCSTVIISSLFIALVLLSTMTVFQVWKY